MDAPWINYTTLDTKNEDLTPDVEEEPIDTFSVVIYVR